MKAIQRFFSSIRLTVLLLAVSTVLVFFGTLDQVHYGIFHTQQRYFESLFVVWSYPVQWPGHEQLGWIELPLPGGYLIGPLLVLNLFFAHFRYYRSGWRKSGIVLIHAGLVLLLVGQLWTQLRQKEYFMWLAEGESNNYVESFHTDELVVIDRSDPERDRVYSWPVEAFSRGQTELRHPGLPFRLRVVGYAQNAAIFPLDQGPPNTPDLNVSRGIGADRNLTFIQIAPTFREGERNVTTALVDVITPEGPRGRWIVSNVFRQRDPMREFFPRQTFEVDGREFEIALRFKRRYLPETVKLIEFRHDRYPGTDIPFNFSSEVVLGDPASDNARRALIYMNHPLRHDGLTFYQASFAEGDTMSMFQVVGNPARWIPYWSTLIISLGLLLQFGLSFISRFYLAPAGAADTGDRRQTLLTRPSSQPRARAMNPTRTTLPQRIAVGAIVVFAALLFLRHAMPERHGTDFDIAAFLALPVQEGGRIKPADTVARTTLLVIANRTTVRDGDERLGAAEWFTEFALDPARSVERPIFRVEHPEVMGILGIPADERMYVSLTEILPHFDTLRAQWDTIPEESQLRTSYEAALAKLRDAIGVYDSLSHAFIGPPILGRSDTGLRMLRRALDDRATLDPDSGERGTVENALALFGEHFARAARTTALATIPPVHGADHPLAEWSNLGTVLLEATETGKLDPLAITYAEMAAAYRAGDAVAFNSRVADAATLLAARGQAPEGKIAFEHFFNQFSPFTYAAVVYLLVFLCAAASWIVWPRVFANTAFWLMAAAFAVHTFGMFTHAYLMGRPPVTNLYTSAIFVGWGTVLLCLFLEKRFRNGLAAAAAAPVGFCTLIIAYHLSFTGDTVEVMRAVLDSNFWLATHVPTVTIGYSANFLAGSLAIVYLLRDRLFGGLPAPSARLIEGMVYGVICFALLFSFVGTVLGGIWADQSWGRFWGWDPKENGALMIVLWNALILHARWAKLAPPTGIMQLAIVGNIITAWSWFGTNMLGVGLHAYGFMDAAFFWLIAFVLSQLACIALGWMPRLRLFNVPRETTPPDGTTPKPHGQTTAG